MTCRNTDARSTSIWCYSNSVRQPPELITRYDENGDARTEDLLITGWFACDEDAWLANHQVGLSYACYNFRTAHFERCLLSEDNHRVLRELQLKGQFETPFYLSYSLRHLYHLELL